MIVFDVELIESNVIVLFFLIRRNLDATAWKSSWPKYLFVVNSL